MTTPADYPRWAFVFAAETNIDTDAPLDVASCVCREERLFTVRAYGPGGARAFASFPSAGEAWAAVEGVLHEWEARG